jgi:hypothetical protein
MENINELIMENWENLVTKMGCLFVMALCAACGTTNVYECQINAKGSRPSNMSYYVMPADSSRILSPEYMEYANYLKRYLNGKDYVETDASSAALRIEMDYTLGEPLSRSTTVATTEYSHPGFSFGPGVTNVNSQNAVSVNGKGVSVNIDNPEALFVGMQQKQLESKSGVKSDKKKQGTPLMAPVPTKTTYETVESRVIPLRVVLRAYDNRTRQLVWKVLAKDELEAIDQLQLVMPWLLVCAVDHVGEQMTGEATVALKDKPEIRAAYGLIWPY